MASFDNFFQQVDLHISLAALRFTYNLSAPQDWKRGTAASYYKLVRLFRKIW